MYTLDIQNIQKARVRKHLFKSRATLNISMFVFGNGESRHGLDINKIKGIKICRQAKAHWVEKFDKRQSPMGKDYYWLTGEFINEDKGDDTDEAALAHGYISVVPTQFDLTAHHAIQKLNSWDFND